MSSTDPLMSPNTRYAEARDTAQRLASAMYSGWSPQRREDLVQVVMQNLWRRFEHEDWPDNLQAFLRTAVRHAAINMHDMDARRLSDPAGIGGTYEPVGDARLGGWLNELQASPSAVTARRLILDDMFALLPERDAQLLTWRYVDNLPPRMIAQHLDIHPNAVTQAVARATTRLKAELANHPEIVAAL